MQQEIDLSGGSDVRSLRAAFVEVHQELEAKFPDYESHSKEHSSMAQVHANVRPATNAVTRAVNEFFND